MRALLSPLVLGAIASVTTHPNEEWMMKMARNLTDAEEPFLPKHSVLDHASGYEVFRNIPRGVAR